MLYTFVISPLELLFEVLFSITNRLTGNEGLSIIVLSIAINFLVLPLYKRADELQSEERDIQAKMAYRIKRTKQTFKGNERFYMLQEYYRINNYKPVYALKSSISLLLQIPFFIAAYRFLSNLQSLQGMTFLFIPDLGKEDALFMIGSFPVNMLPIMMTLINIISGYIYTRGQPIKSKVQVYGLAIIFLVLLYHSPSGLVFYWLLNNLFSLVKNIFYKLNDPKKVFRVVLSVAAIILFVFTLFRPWMTTRRKSLVCAGCILLFLPLISSLIPSKFKEKLRAKHKDTITYFAGAVFMSCFTGFLIPSSVISSSTEEFLNIMNPYYNPFWYIANSMLLAFGTFVLWGGVFYFLMNDKMKSVFTVGIWIISGISVVDYMFFGTKLGIMSSTLVYDTTPVFSKSEYIINSVVVISVVAVFFLVYWKFPKITKAVIVSSALAVLGLGIFNTVKIEQTYDWFKENVSLSSEVPHFSLNRNGKNVVVIMLDRAVGTQVPYIFNEKPELKEKFDGFTYYPNTISYGVITNNAVPALLGGYEYTPERINARDSEFLVDKHNEALKVMPVLFGNNGFDVTLFDPTYAGYKLIPDLSVFDEYESFNCYISEGYFDYFKDVLKTETQYDTYARINDIRNRNFYLYSLMKVSPLLFQDTIYNEGYYNEEVLIPEGEIAFVSDNDGSDNNDQDWTSVYNECGFLKCYSVLVELPEITVIYDGSENTYLYLANHATHEPCILQEPDYLPAAEVDNTEYDRDMISRYTIDGKTMRMENTDQIGHYHVNMASYIALGEWFDYLRENDVYDNTRIIIVSDHGRGLYQFDVQCIDESMESFMPVLLVKDFNATGFNVCNDFMTNADTPVLATAGLIDDPVNPFTGNPIASDYKNGPQTVLYSGAWDVETNNGTTFLPGSWFIMDGDPHDSNSWTYEGWH